MKELIFKLATLIAVMCFNFSVYAYDFEVDGLYYELNQDQNSCTIVKHPSGKYTGDIEIPAIIEYRGHQLIVNTIGERCFTNCKINSLVIPHSVTRVKGWALASNGYDDAYIDKLVIQDSNQKIIFEKDGGAVYSDDIKANEVYIGRSCEGGEIYIYHGSVSFGNILMSIETPIYFNQRENIDTIIIPESINKISLNYGYVTGATSRPQIKNLIIEDSENNLDISGNICSISNLYVGRNITNIISIDIDKIEFSSALSNIPKIGDINLKSIILPNNLTSIPNEFLKGCTGLTRIFIPKGVNSIGFGAFQNCSSLQFISLPNAIDIPADCFNGCYNLKFIEGSRGIFKIGENAFAKTGLTDFNLSENLQIIEKNAFSDSKLKRLYFSSNNFSCSSTAFSGLNYLENIYYYSLPKEYQDGIGFSNLNYRETNLIVQKDWIEEFKETVPWSKFWIISPFSDVQDVKFKYETIGGEVGTGVLITEILDIESDNEYFDLSAIEFKSTNDEIVSVNWPYIYFNSVGDCQITMSQNSNQDKCEISVIVKNFLPEDFTIDNVKYRRLEGYNVEVCEVNSKGEAIIPSIVTYEDILFQVIKIAAQIGDDVTHLTIPETCKELVAVNVSKSSILRELTIEPSKSSLLIGCGDLHLSNSITPFPNPSTVDEKRTGFRDGYYDGLFFGLPIEHLVINRNIELSKYYERTMSSNTSGYSTVYNDIVYYPPFYGLTNLKYLEIGENVSAICKNQIEAVVSAVPATMGYTNFGKCDNIEVVVSNNPNAPIGGGFSQTVYENASLFLPNDGIESYKNDDYWKNFAHISEATFIPIESISFESDDVTIDINDSKILHPLINPSNASIKTLKWNSTIPSIVSVSEDGIITSSTQDGEAIITATASDGTNASASIKIVVQEGAGISDVVADDNFDISIKDGSILISGKSETDIVEIFNIQGQLIKSSTSNIIPINSNGVYLVKVGSVCKKIVL